MGFRKIKKYMNEVSKHKYYCKCGHTLFMPYGVDRKLCDWCGYYFYKDKKYEFKERLGALLNGR